MDYMHRIHKNWQGDLKRVQYILLLLFAAVYPLRSQLTTIDGELRYQHQFQDVYTAGTYSKLVRKNPQFILGTAGYLYSPSILSFHFRSALNLYYNNITSGGVTNSYKQSVFNFYDINADALSNSIVRFSISARDLEMRSTSNFNRYGGSLSSYRQQEQRISVSSSNINFLPTTIFSFSRIHNYSALSLSNFNNRQNEFSLILSQATQDGTFNVSGIMNDNRDDITGFRYKFYRIQFNGSKEFSTRHRVDFNSEYYKYGNISLLSGNGNYNGKIGEKIRFNSNLIGRNIFSSLSTSQMFSIGQTVQYLQNDNFHYSFNVQDQLGSDIIFGTGGKTPNNQFNTSASIEHMRSAGSFNFGNSLSLSNSQFRSNIEQRSTSLGVTNNVQTTISRFQLSANQGITYARTTGYLSRDEINNYGNFIVNGMLPYNITSQTSIDYRNERRLYTTEYFFNRQTLMINQMLNTFLYYYIPINIALGGSVNWNWYKIYSRIYGVNGNLSSNNFFLSGLSMNYRFNRTYDIFFRKPYFDHMLEFNYQWRALSFQFRIQEFRFIDVRHEVWFIVTRPFNIGL